MIMQEALADLKRFLKPLQLNARCQALVVRCVAGFCLHWGRMSAVRASQTVASEPLHRAQICRFLGRKHLRKKDIVAILRAQLLAREGQRGRYYFLVDQTLCSQQGDKTENTYSTGNRKRRPSKSRRHGKYKYTPKRCHCFVMGLLITPSGLRLPYRRCYYTAEYCKKQKRAYRTQIELAAELIRELPSLPAGSDLVVLGDAAFDAKEIHKACKERDYSWIVPANSERVLAVAKPRPKVRALLKEFSAEQFKAITLKPNQPNYAAARRLSAYRIGRKVKERVYYVYHEIREVQSVGIVRIVFSTRNQPQAGQTVDAAKILMTNNVKFSAAEVVQMYDLRWQIELYFKELKSSLGFAQYRFRKFEQVQGWLELTLATFLYLELLRAVQIERAKTAEEKVRWQRKRTYGMCVALRQRVQQADIDSIAKALETPGGIQRLRKKLRSATQKEYRDVA